MRNELIDLYAIAIANREDKDIVKAYQRARDRIGPQIVMDEIINNDILKNRIVALEHALKDLLSVTPVTKNDYSGVGYCFGCGVVKWYSGQDSNSPAPCKENCPLQNAIHILGKP